METIAHSRVLLVANTAWYLYNFRRTLAHSMRLNGVEPVFVSPAGDHAKLLQKEGFRWIEFELDRSGINPLKEFRSCLRLYQIYRRESPALVHHFTIKCVLLGTLAAFAARVPATVNAITGVGHFLTGESKRAKLLRPIISLTYAALMRLPGVKLIFQNPDDLAVFKKMRIASSHKSYLIRSSGVDTVKFSPPPAKITQELIVVFGGRLLSEKGIREFLNASSLLIERGINISFRIAGDQDPGNPSSLSDEELSVWKKQGWLTFMGHQDDMVEVLSEADLVVLPSYREGVPKILLEAAAMEKPIVATDVPGCREIVEDGLNGRLVPAKNAVALADAIEELIHNQALRKKMGEAGREKVIREFDATAVAKKTIEVYGSFASLRNQP